MHGYHSSSCSYFIPGELRTVLATMVKHIVDRLLEQKDVYSLYLPGFQCINKHNIYILYLYIYDKRQTSVYVYVFLFCVQTSGFEQPHFGMQVHHVTLRVLIYIK